MQNHHHRAPKQRHLARKSLVVMAAGALVPLTAMIPAASAATEITITPSSTAIHCGNTRVDGHNVIEKRGRSEVMHVFTADVASVPAPDSRKAACDIDVPAQSIGEVGSPDLGWSYNRSSVQHIEPGVQIVGTSFRLVGEASVYGADDIWAANESTTAVKQAAPSCDGSPEAVTDPAIHCSGGSGSYWHGSPAAWQSALETADIDTTVHAIGWSLGSGVSANGYISSIEYADTVIDFSVTDEPPVETPVAPHVSDNSTTACRQLNLDVLLPDPASGTYYNPATINYRIMVGGHLEQKGTFAAGDEYTSTLTFSKSHGTVSYKVFEGQTSYPKTLVSSGAVNRNCYVVGS